MPKFGIVEGGNGSFGMFLLFVCDKRKPAQTVGVLVTSKVETVNTANLSEHVTQTKCIIVKNCNFR